MSQSGLYERLQLPEISEIKTNSAQAGAGDRAELGYVFLID